MMVGQVTISFWSQAAPAISGGYCEHTVWWCFMSECVSCLFLLLANHSFSLCCYT